MVSSILLQIFLGLIFLIVALFCFTFSGLVILRKFIPDLDDLEKFTLVSVFGLVIFTLSAYILMIANLRFLMWFFPVVGLWSLIKLRCEILSFRPKIIHKVAFLLVFTIGIIGMVAVNAPSGFPYRDGIYFYSSHGHDGIWHLALMEQMHKNIFPLQNPEYAGHKLQNYHFFVDLLMSEFSRLFTFSNLDIYFRFMPAIFSILLGLSGFIFVRLWSKSEIAGIWSMVFIYFAGSFGFIVTFIKDRQIGGETTFWVSQTQSVLGNPPHAAAFIIVTTFLFCLLKYFKNYRLSYFIVCVILGGSIIGFKVYGGLLILAGLAVLGIFEIVIKRKIKTLFLFMLTFVLSFSIYFPNSVNSQDFLVWQPWWYIRTMIVVPDRLGWLDLELRRQTYIAEHNWKRVIQVELTALLLFLVGNLGMRLIGFWTVFKIFKNNIFKDSFNLFFILITFASFFIPVFFLQKGVVWNSIQFNQYFLLFFGFFAAKSMVSVLDILRNVYWRVGISAFIILFSIPTQIGLLRQFYTNPPLSKISYEEISALNFLKNHTSIDVIILTAPFNKYEREKYTSTPIPIYAWYDTGYIPAISGRMTLISDEEQVNIMGYKADLLLESRKRFFSEADSKEAALFLRNNNISYIYLVWDQVFPKAAENLVELIYQNKDARIYQVKN